MATLTYLQAISSALRDELHTAATALGNRIENLHKTVLP